MMYDDTLPLPAVLLGVVVNNVDPEGLHRVKFKVDGVIEPESAWAWPMGTLGGGSAKRGAWQVPEVDADVLVMFIDGDPDRPVYMAGHWGIRAGQSEVPTPVGEVPAAQAHQIAVLKETGRYLVYTDERAASLSLTIKDKISGDKIEFDSSPSTGPGITIQASAAIILKADGLVSIEGAQVQIQGRLVQASKKPI